MQTKPHRNTARGYSLRVGTHLPKNATNLAYVASDTPEPTKNISLEDFSGLIVENQQKETTYEEQIAFSEDTFLLKTKEGQTVFPKREIYITDDYLIEGKTQTPLYFFARSKGLFDARLSKVAVPHGGGASSGPKRFEETKAHEKDLLLYLGQNIVVTRENSEPLHPAEKVKIQLVKEGSETHSYRVVVLTNFTQEKSLYEIHYEKMVGQKRVKVTEFLNFDPIFEEVPYETLLSLPKEKRLSSKQYAVKEVIGGGYSFYAPSPDEGQATVIRQADFFSYQIEADLKTRIHEHNPNTLQVGFVYLNTSAINQVNVLGAGKKLFYQNKLTPSYLTFDNPHRLPGIHDKSNVLYWQADLNMPLEHYLDYDVLILAGQGKTNLSKYTESFLAFLNKGGTLLIDDASTGNNVLSFQEKTAGPIQFLRNINFQLPSETLAPLVYEKSANRFNQRYYQLKNEERIGQDPSVLTFLNGEYESDWQVLLAHRNQSPAVIESINQYPGRLLYSSVGLTLDVLYNKEETLQFFTNYFLYLSENRFFSSPMFQEYVYHKDALFLQEYRKEDGQIVYFEDLDDTNRLSIVAKKQLAPSVQEEMARFLPSYMKKATGTYQVRLFDETFLPLENASFEQAQGNVRIWNTTTQDAMPGWDVVKFAGTKVTFEQQKEEVYKGQYAGKIVVENSQAFFEKNLGTLTPGHYELSCWAKLVTNEAVTLIGLYDTSGEKIFEGKREESGFNWKELTFAFTLTESKDLYLRLGAHEKNESFTATFDELVLKTKSRVQMTPMGDGHEVLYAYATETKGQGLDVSLFDTSQEVLIYAKPLTIQVQVKAMVYHWTNDLASYRKKYGHTMIHSFTLNEKQGNIELNKLIALLPSMNDGIEWASKQNVYYEIQLLENEDNRYVNLELYDPSTQKYYYSHEGKILINYEDLHYDSYHTTVSLRAKTSYYELALTKRKYTFVAQPVRPIQVFAPKTVDERDNWYLSIQNGAFKKQAVDLQMIEELTVLAKEDHFNDYLFGHHEYSLPEYHRQAFYPSIGERLVFSEKAEYLNRRQIKVQKTPLLVREEVVEKEKLLATDNTKLIYQAKNNWWKKDPLPKIYWRQTPEQKEQILNNGYTIDYEEGLLVLDLEKLPPAFVESIQTGELLASYTHDNFKIVKRKYQNERIRFELLKTRDSFTFTAEKGNWATYPQPILYRNGKTPAHIVSPSEYIIDSSSGSVTFFEQNNTRLYVDYNYFLEEECIYEDVDTQNGRIKLQKEIQFQDELYVSYVYKENNLEYKGYYDEEAHCFHHLDLNPTTGHTFTLKQELNGLIEYLDVPSEKLLGKEIFLYLLPTKSTYDTKVIQETHCLRHVFSEQEWLKIKATSPLALLLARIQVRENTMIENTVVMDARRSGGGLKEHLSEKEIKAKTGDVSAFWDIGHFDGLAYYQNSVLVIQLPETVLRRHGGQFDEEEIERRLQKYASFGSFPIIEYTKGDD